MGESLEDRVVARAVESRAFAAYGLWRHSEQPIQPKAAGPALGIPAARPQQHPAAVPRVVLAGQLGDRELLGLARPAQDDDRPVLTPSGVLLEGHPGPHDLTRIGVAVGLGRVGEADGPGVHPGETRAVGPRVLAGLPVDRPRGGRRARRTPS
jgi:hypothetical protein